MSDASLVFIQYPNMNLELVEKIVSLLGEYPVSEIAVESGELKVHVIRPLTSAAPSAAALSPEPSLTLAAEGESLPEEIMPETIVLTSPMVGIFYHAEPPLPLAAEVSPGQIVGSIESMKLMNDVVAGQGGRIVEVLVEDGAPVDYGRALFRLAVL